MNVIAGTVVKTPVFPAQAVETTMLDALIKAIRSRYRRKKLSLPAKDSDLIVALIEIDSMFVVEQLASLDDLLPFKVSEAVVRPGGYSSIEEAAKHVTKRVAAKWAKRAEGKKL